MRKCFQVFCLFFGFWGIFLKSLEASPKSFFDNDDRGFCTKPLNQLSNLLNICVQVTCICSAGTGTVAVFPKKKNEFSYGNIQKQWSPLASGFRWWGWHTDLRMLLGQLLASNVALLCLVLTVRVLCLLPPFLPFEWYSNVTGHAGVLEHISGHQCCDAVCQDASKEEALSKTQVFTSCWIVN